MRPRHPPQGDRSTWPSNASVAAFRRRPRRRPLCPRERTMDQRPPPADDVRQDSRADPVGAATPPPAVVPLTCPAAAPPTVAPNDAPPVPAVSGEQMRTVLDVSRMLAVPTELDPLLGRIAEAATVLLRCERASIFLYDPLA